MLSVDEVRPYYQNDAAHDFDHVLRVLANAQRIGQAEGADMAILQTAVLLHDVARADQDRTGKNHAVEGARRARHILADTPPAFVEAVAHAIETHRYRIHNPPLTLEAKILYDADKLDSIGAIGVARVFAYTGHHQRPLWAEDTAGVHTARQEFHQKLVKVKDTLFTPTAHQMAEERHRFMIQFFEQMSAEIAGLR